MKIHEYQAKELLKRYGIPVPRGNLCRTVDKVRRAVAEKGGTAVIKAQVHRGGRGKAGGIKVAGSSEEAAARARHILGMDIGGSTVNKVLVEEVVDITEELYIGLINDRTAQAVTLIASREGGVDIEDVARATPEKILRYPIDPLTGLREEEARNVALKMSEDPEVVSRMGALFLKLYALYVDTDATLAEINPLAVTSERELRAVDAKMNFDDNALFRQPDILALRDDDEEDKREIAAGRQGLSYIRLDGNIGCIVNGAGLAMATMDMIHLYGGSPANFLDIGGGSNPRKVVDAMRLLVSEPAVRSVLINIFGGITRCDDVAKGLIEALASLEVNMSVVVRLSGTNAEEGRALLERNHVPTAASMSEAVRIAIEMCRQAAAGENRVV